SHQGAATGGATAGVVADGAGVGGLAAPGSPGGPGEGAAPSPVTLVAAPQRVTAPPPLLLPIDELDPGAEVVVSQVPSQRRLNNLDIRRDPRGNFVLRLALSEADIPVDIEAEDDQIALRFVDATLPARLERTLDVTAFDTPVTQVAAFNALGGARLVISTGEYTDYQVLRDEGRYNLIVEAPRRRDPVSNVPPPARFEGAPLTLDFADIEIRALLQIIAEFTGLNIVVSDTVTGNITINLRDVPWDQALEVVLRLKGLTQQREGNIIFIAPTEEFAAREQLAPLFFEVFILNYARAEELAEVIRATAEGGTTVLSPRGHIAVDNRTNSLLIQDIQDRIDAVRNLVAILDVPMRQVLLTARIVIANDDFIRELGVGFGVVGPTPMALISR
ncbi:MAG: secretin N-terminal domain-containing protein, partial [Candidatus Competibacterales bacterium]